MEKATSTSLTLDHSRDCKPGQGRPESDTSKSNLPLKNVVNKISGWSYRCYHCGAKFDGLRSLQVHFKACVPPVGTDDDEDENKDEDDDDDEEDEYEYVADNSNYNLQARLYAEWTMKYLNELDEDKKYELVKVGPYHAAGISRGPIFHLNLKARERDCPGAQVETFFAQARMHPAFQVDLCVSLGPSQNLPRKAYLDGCAYCRRCGYRIHHPVDRCAKLIRGVEGDDVSWLYGDK